MTDFANLRAMQFPCASKVRNAENASLSSPGTSEQTPFDSCSGSIGTTLSTRYTLVERRYASLSRGLPGVTKCETSAMWTPSTLLPFLSVSSESASSKSRAIAGSHVNMNFRRRSSRLPASSMRELALSAAANTCFGKAGGRPYCSITERVSSDGLSAGPITSVTIPSGARRGFSQRARRMTTRSPTAAPRVSGTRNSWRNVGLSGCTRANGAPAVTVPTIARGARFSMRAIRPSVPSRPSCTVTMSPGNAVERSLASIHTAASVSG